MAFSVFFASGMRWNKVSPAGVAVVSVGLLLAAAPGHGQTPTPGAPTPGAAKAQTVTTKPAWSDLTPAQQAALAPLATAWAGISELQKRKWIALAHTYPNLPAAERTTLHGRMTEWAALSPAQRNQARLNFSQTKDLSAEEKKAHWEAYQALSPDQKKKLAAKAQSKTTGAAPAVTPVAPNKLAVVPITRSESDIHRSVPGTRAGKTGSLSPKAAASGAAPAVRP